MKDTKQEVLRNVSLQLFFAGEKLCLKTKKRNPVSNYLLKNITCVCHRERKNTRQRGSKILLHIQNLSNHIKYNEMKKKLNGLTVNLSNLATFTAILKITLPQCNAILARTPPVPALSEVLF